MGFREYHHGFDGITLTEFDVKTMKLKPETERTIWRGTDVKLTEGPHLYKINGYYYLFAAEGGTVYTHQEVVARSKSLDALSFEGMPSNPFITNFDTPRSYLQKQGHGALVDTPSGEWYYASLCGRPWHHDNESFTDPRAGARWGVKPPSRRSNGPRMAGRILSEAMADSVMWMLRRMPSRLRHLRITASMTISCPIRWI